MSQGLPNQTGSDGTQEADISAADSASHGSASSHTKSVLDGATGFAGVLEQDERLIGGILISIPTVLTVIIFVIPAEQRFTLTCLMLGSVLLVGLLIFLLIKYRSKRVTENIVTNRELQSTNSALAASKLELESQLKTLRNVSRDSTRERRAFLFKLKGQVNQIIERSELSLQNDEITKDEVLDINQQISSLFQQIQDALNVLQKMQGSLSDAEDLEAVDSSFERELMERFKQRQ